MQKDLLREIGPSLLGPHALASSLSVQRGHGGCAGPRIVLPGPGLLPRCLPAGAYSTLTQCGAPALPWGGEASLPPSARPSDVLSTSYKAHTFCTPPPSPGITDEQWDTSTTSNSVRRSNPVFFCPQHLSEHLRGSGVKCRPRGVHRSSLAICSCKTRVKHRGQSLVWM